MVLRGCGIGVTDLKQGVTILKQAKWRGWDDYSKARSPSPLALLMRHKPSAQWLVDLDVRHRCRVD